MVYVKAPTITEEEAKVMIFNRVYYGVKFKSEKLAFEFVDKNCPSLWTRLFKKVNGEWIVAGSILPKSGA